MPRPTTPPPCLVCGSPVAVIRSKGARPDEVILVDSLRVCSNAHCLSNGGYVGAGEAV